MRRLALWSIALPLMLAGTELAHALAYRIVYPEASVRWQALAASGHGYMSGAPLVLGIAGAIALAGLLSTVVDTVRRQNIGVLPAWGFGVLPLIGFTLQEFLERWLAVGSLPWWMFEQPTFRVGLLLQLPFALLAYVAARLLLRVGRAIGRVLAPAAGLPPAAGVPAPVRPLQFVLPRSSARSPGWGVRGPPLLSA